MDSYEKVEIFWREIAWRNVAQLYRATGFEKEISKRNLAKRCYERAFITFYYKLRKLLCQQQQQRDFSV